MASIVLKTLSVLLGLFFLFVGSMKLTPKISKDMHKDMRRSYIQYAKVFPLSQTLGFKVPSKWYRNTVGALEVGSGFTLLFIPGFMKLIANVVLVTLSVLGVYTHWIIQDKFERTAPALVFLFMVTCRLIIYIQCRRAAKLQGATAAVVIPSVADEQTASSLGKVPGKRD